MPNGRPEPSNGQDRTLTEEKVRTFATAARKRLRKSDGTYRRDHLRAVAQRIEVVDKTEARIMGSRTALLKTLTAASAQTAAHGVPTLELKWRTREDSNLWPLPSELRLGRIFINDFNAMKLAVLMPCISCNSNQRTTGDPAFRQ